MGLNYSGFPNNSMRKVGEMGMKEYIVQAYSQETIDSFDAHNAPEIVRCNNCVLRFTNKCVLHDQAFPVNKGNDWFCADGERRSDNG